MRRASAGWSAFHDDASVSGSGAALSGAQGRSAVLPQWPGASVRESVPYPGAPAAAPSALREPSAGSEWSVGLAFMPRKPFQARLTM